MSGDWQSGLAGGISGVVTRAIVAPLDVVKIRLQLQHVPKDSSSSSSSRKYSGILRGMQTIIREEGASSLWKGNLVAEVLWGSYMSVQFFAYTSLKRRLPKITVVCGGGAGLAGTLATYPLDFLRTRMAAQPEPRVYKNLAEAIRLIHASEGAVGFFRGLGPALVQVVPYMGVQFAVYEALLRWSRSFPGLEKTAGHLLCGCSAGVAGKACTLPLDVAKKRMQVWSAPGDIRRHLQAGSAVMEQAEGGGSRPRSMSLCGMWRHIWRSEGLAGFFRGASPSVAKTAISSGLSFAIFEHVHELIGGGREPRL